MMSGFIGTIISTVFGFLLSLVITFIQIVAFPLNLAITAGLPDFSAALYSFAHALDGLLTAIPWILSFFPPYTLGVFLFILAAELIFTAVLQIAWHVAKLWIILQLIKFW